MLLDTDVLVDLVRKLPSAQAWLGQQSTPPGVPGFAAMELLWGCQNRAAQKQVEKWLRLFPLCWPSGDCLNVNLKELPKHHLSHGLGLIDALIAATALDWDEPLATFNTRHYHSVFGLMTIEPYTR